MIEGVRVHVTAEELVAHLECAAGCGRTDDDGGTVLTLNFVIMRLGDRAIDSVTFNHLIA